MVICMKESQIFLMFNDAADDVYFVQAVYKNNVKVILAYACEA